jgi:PhnB protein
MLRVVDYTTEEGRRRHPGEENGMKSINPYLNFPGTTEEAFTFYRGVFGGEFPVVLRFRDFGGDSMGVPEAELDKIAHIALPLGKDHLLMGTDVVSGSSSTFTIGNNVYITIEPDNPTEARKLFAGLCEGGRVEMALQRTEWAELHGSCTDRFGVQWMIDFTGNVEFTTGKLE